MAGFQYVVVANDSGEKLDKKVQAGFFLQIIGFGMSLSGTLISLLSVGFLKGMMEEPEELQVEGILRNRFFSN